MVALLRQGLTPEGIALSLAFGLAAGIFPVIGAPGSDLSTASNAGAAYCFAAGQRAKDFVCPPPAPSTEPFGKNPSLGGRAADL